jgi:hypothetical protein
MESKKTSPLFTRKKISQYCYDKLTGTFMGFLIGMSATGLVAQFFETRSIRNLWGLTARKTVVDKNTFAYFEWFISLVIGFVVFEIFTNYVKRYLDTYTPQFRIKIFRWIVRTNLLQRIKNLRLKSNEGRVALFAAMQHGTKAALNKSAKR